jgi:biofilm PGA synthesis N-glycosyltransferase PgaC
MEVFIGIVGIVLIGLIGASLTLLAKGGKDLFVKGVNWFLGVPQKLESKVDFKVDVVIPAYNEEEHIEKTIRSIQGQTYSVERIIVVDDESADCTAEIARKAGAEVIRTPQNTGTKAGAQNWALPFLSSEIAVFVDADTVLDKEAIANILSPFLDGQVASVGGFLVNQRVRSIWEKFRFIEYLYWLSLHRGAQNRLGVPLNASGGFSAYRLSLLREVGGFPTRTMGEDMDLTWEFLLRGKRVVFAENALCYTLDPPTYKVYRAQIERWYRAFFQIISVHKKHLHRNKKLMFLVCWYVGISAAGLLSLIVGIIFRRAELLALPGFLLGNTLLVTLVSFWKGLKLGRGWTALKAIPAFWLVRWINLFFFWRACWLEWIKREKLTIWHKGH